ncbi:hypothetical protein ERO13_A11G207600v2 [Gossypium hirsutum]|nr:hypothetical protein ERO13_A11G207600v2 [Gossypium hirsutum]
MTLRIPLLRSPKEGKTTVRRAANVATAAPSKKGTLGFPEDSICLGQFLFGPKVYFTLGLLFFGFCI